MTLQEKSVLIMLRSHITPSASIQGFEPGKKLQVLISENSTIRDFAERFFAQNKNHIGIIAVNGKVVPETYILREGDLVDIYALIPGG